MEPNYWPKYSPSYSPQKMEFAARLKAARRAVKLSQERAAAAVGTSRRHWIRWENGETSPNPAYLKRIAEVLGDESLAADDEDDEEAARAMTFDDFLTLRVRQIVQAERVRV